MRVHHLNCGTLCPISQRLVNGEGSLLSKARLVCHCLLVETAQGLVLVDTGIGTADIANASERLGGLFTTLVRPELDTTESAIRQVEGHGFHPEDVRHIVLTHLDIDHAGGLSDFPWATVHLMQKEKTAADTAKGAEGHRYRGGLQWEHDPKWQLYDAAGGDWFGFEAVRELVGLPAEILLVPLYGHTRGHAGVAIETKRGWLLHCGDAYFYHGEVDVDHPHVTPFLSLFQRLGAIKNDLRLRNQARLRELKRQHEHEVSLFCSHSPVELEEQQRQARAFSERPPPQVEVSRPS